MAVPSLSPLGGVLLVACPDQPGIVASVATYLFDHGANIVESDQFTTPEAPRRFFLRIQFEGVPSESLAAEFQPLADRFGMSVQFVSGARRKRLAVFVSKEDHCLQELLWQIQAGDIAAEVPLILSNHTALQPIADRFGIPFLHLPLTPESKAEVEQRQLAAVQGMDAVVLAKYMQILSPKFLAEVGRPIINIHHSFLPAFVGARPYHQAYERGVKIIGATGHYVTEELDAGPIIHQDVERVDHRANAEALRRIGRHIERSVLAKAVKWHVEDRVMLDRSRTVVFA